MSFSKNPQVTIYTLLPILLVAVTYVSGQNCSCASNVCCSRYGYCGLGNDYCGDGCKSGPCNSPQGNNGVRVNEIVTNKFFNGILNQAVGCPGKGFYTREAFLQALRSYPAFGTAGSPDVSRREIAAFFAHVSDETGRMCAVVGSGGGSDNFCDKTNTQYPCVQYKSYHGRGPLQLTRNYNYGPAGESIGFDGLNNPDIVSQDNVISFKTAFWYWMRTGHDPLVTGQGFGATIRALKGPLVCDGGSNVVVTTRVNYFTTYCEQLGVNPGHELRC